MKRILAILCVIACLCGLCVPALAADTITVSVKAPDGWAEVYLYVWENENAYETWPGTAMTKGSDGWWTLEIPAGYTNVIANNGNEMPQTVDLKMNGTSDASITVTTDTGDGKHFNADVAQDGSSTPSTPNTPDTPSAGIDLSGLNSLALVGSSIPGVGAWAPEDPAGDMTKASNGVYTKVIAVTAGTSMQLKIAGNDAWDDNYNFGPAEDGTPIVLGTKMEMINGAGAQNFALTAEKDCNLKFTVDLTGDVPTVLVEETTEEADTVPSDPGTTTPDSGETITVYAKVPESWTDVRLWAWDDAKHNASAEDWPGNIYMTLGDNGWYSVELPLGYTNILINANGGGSQTADLVIEAGKDVWVDALTDSANAVVYYEEVEITVPVVTDPPATQPSSGQSSTNTTEPGDKDEKKTPTDNTVLFSVIGSVIVIAIAAVVYIILMKKQG